MSKDNKLRNAGFIHQQNLHYPGEPSPNIPGRSLLDLRQNNPTVNSTSSQISDIQKTIANQAPYSQIIVPPQERDDIEYDPSPNNNFMPQGGFRLSDYPIVHAPQELRPSIDVPPIMLPPAVNPPQPSIPTNLNPPCIVGEEKPSSVIEPNPHQ